MTNRIIELARKAGLKVATNISGVTLVGSPLDGPPAIAHITIEEMERFAAIVRAQVLGQVPDLDLVISWLENGCNPQDAANELRLYAGAIRALKEET